MRQIKFPFQKCFLVGNSMRCVFRALSQGGIWRGSKTRGSMGALSLCQAFHGSYLDSGSPLDPRKAVACSDLVPRTSCLPSGQAASLSLGLRSPPLCFSTHSPRSPLGTLRSPSRWTGHALSLPCFPPCISKE